MEHTQSGPGQRRSSCRVTPIIGRLTHGRFVRSFGRTREPPQMPVDAHRHPPGPALQNRIGNALGCFRRSQVKVCSAAPETSGIPLLPQRERQDDVAARLASIATIIRKMFDSIRTRAMGKTANQFVCEHLENISRTALEKFQDIVRSYVRRREGVYALYKGPKLYYVGLASNLRSRLTAHLNDRHGSSWDRFSVYLTKSDTRLRELEALVLRIVRPSGNRQIGRFGAATDLRKTFACDIRQAHREEYHKLIGKPHASTKKKAGSGIPTSTGNERIPVLAAYEKRPKKLRARFKGSVLRAHVRKDGRIGFGGSIYDSPSVAAAAACGRKTCNGWKFWQYERAPGDWVLLDELRR